MKTPSATFCSMPWNHQFIDPTGRVKPCCRFAENHRPVENNLNHRSLREIFEGTFMEDVRKRMLQGDRVAGCIRCYQEEAAGKKSLRERYLESRELPLESLVNLKSPEIRWIELAISNDCNLACRMCDSRYSWKWFKEEKESFAKTYNTVERSKSDISQVYQFLDKIVHLKFTGGEPLITPDHWKLIDKLLLERDCKEIFLNYSTNCTIMPLDSWVEKWSRFKRVEFALSFDSANPHESEYIRWPSKFATTEAVTKRFIQLKKSHGFQVFLRSTISLLNIWHMPETLEWWFESDLGIDSIVNPTHLTYPDFLSVTVLPRSLKTQVEAKFKSYIEHSSNSKIAKNLNYMIQVMNRQDDSHLLPTLRDYLEKTDSYRKQNFGKSYPWFSSIVEEPKMQGSYI